MGMLIKSLFSHLKEVINDHERDENDQEYGRTVGDDKEASQNHEEGIHPIPDQLRQHVVNGFHVTWETVQYSPTRCRIKKGHRGTEDAIEHFLVEDTRGFHRAEGHRHGVDKDEYSWKKMCTPSDPHSKCELCIIGLLGDGGGRRGQRNGILEILQFCHHIFFPWQSGVSKWFCWFQGHGRA